jgi:hypothetical protein
LMLARHYLKFGKVPLYSNWIAIPWKYEEVNICIVY